MGEMKVRPQPAGARETAEPKRSEPARPPTPADMLRELRKPENDPLRRFRS